MSNMTSAMIYLSLRKLNEVLERHGSVIRYSLSYGVGNAKRRTYILRDNATNQGRLGTSREIDTAIQLLTWHLHNRPFIEGNEELCVKLRAELDAAKKERAK